MSENQKLREALLSDMDIAVLRMPVRMAFAGDMAQFQYHNRVQALLNRIEALALPTADHLPEAGKMVETAAPVGELADLPRYTAWSHLKAHGRWPEGIDRAWMKDEMGRYNDVTVSNAVIAELRAALSAGDAGWQPIETAPKDGSDCWLLVDGDVRRGFWVEIEFEERRDMDGRYIDQTDADAYWMDKDSGDSLEPTMFYPITKPLPPAPAMRKGQL